jgi:hypothetical protein
MPRGNGAVAVAKGGLGNGADLGERFCGPAGRPTARRRPWGDPAPSFDAIEDGDAFGYPLR